MTADDPRSERHDRRYAALETSKVPLTESLKETVARFLPVSLPGPALAPRPAAHHPFPLNFDIVPVCRSGCMYW